MKTSDILSALTKLRNDIIIKLTLNSIVSTLIAIVLATKFIEYFNEALAPVFLFVALVLDFIAVVYFIVISIEKYNYEHEQLIRKLK